MGGLQFICIMWVSKVKLWYTSECVDGVEKPEKKEVGGFTMTQMLGYLSLVSIVALPACVLCATIAHRKGQERLASMSIVFGFLSLVLFSIGGGFLHRLVLTPVVEFLCVFSLATTPIFLCLLIAFDSKQEKENGCC